MSQYKSAIRAQQSPDNADTFKYRLQARQLQELFPTWSNDGLFFRWTYLGASHVFPLKKDLQSILTEVSGDVELAATRISDGTSFSPDMSSFQFENSSTGVAEQWGSVSRKKDKKAPSSAHSSKESFSGRGDSRGGRSGRGGRGGPGRGGAAPRGRGGPPQGGAVNGRSPRIGSPHPTHSDGSPSLSLEPKDGTGASGDVMNKIDTAESTAHQNGMTPPAPSWANPPSSHPDIPITTSVPVSSWGVTSTRSTWGGDIDVNGSSSSLNVNVPAPKVPSKSPATSKLSWAQIARFVCIMASNAAKSNTCD